MTQHMWDKTTQLTTKMVKELLSSQFSIEVVDIQLLGEGFDNTVFLINHAFVFRFPHRIQALVCMENEIALLPYLNEKLPFAISAPLLVGHATASYPYAFSGYKMLPGEVLSKAQTPLVNNADFAKTLAKWLKTLHSLPILDEHIGVLKGEHDWRLNVPDRTKKIQEITKKYAHFFSNHGFDVKYLVEKMARFQDLDTTINKPSYVHGDLYSKHIIVDAHGMPTGLIDWGDLHLGHPAIDLSIGIAIFTDPAREIFFEAYGEISQNILQVAIFRAYCHAIPAFAYFSQLEEVTALLWTKAALKNAIGLIDKFSLPH